MTSDEIKAIRGAHANSGIHRGSDLQALWEIAYQLAVMNERNAEADNAGVNRMLCKVRLAERGEMCRWGFHKFPTGFPAPAETCGVCGWTVAEIAARQSPTEVKR